MIFNTKLRVRALLGSAASSLVLGALISASAVAPAAAQDNKAKAADADKEGTEVEQVVVTGTFLRGTPATAVIPVEGTNLEELRDRGNPSNMDFVKGLSEIGSVAGESNRLNGFAIGAQSINLRNLGSQRTVVVFNGRRFPEQYSFTVGRFNNIAQIPNAAIGRVEVLKDGGATTYGADAVGGVVNYITRRNLNGLEATANYRYIKDSNGDFDASLAGGKVYDRFNIMGVVSYAKRNELNLRDRDWELPPYLMNPTSWSSYGSPGAYAFQLNTTGAVQGTASTTATQTGFSTITSFGSTANSNIFGTTTPFNLRYTGDRHISSSGIMRDPACRDLGGFPGWSATPSPVCYYQFGYNSNLVEETETWQAYAEANYEFSPKFKVHGEFTYYGLDIPHTPIDNGGALANSFPLLRTNDTPGGALVTNSAGIPTGASQSSGSNAYFVSGFNPAVANLLGSFKNSDGTSTFSAGQIAAFQAPTTIGGATMAAGRVALVLGTWRPFGYGGNPIGDFQHNYSDQYRYTVDFSGDLGKFLGGTWDWDFAYTLNTLNYVIAAQDILVDRMQAALNGFGGASCNGIRANLSGSTCQFFNPFGSAIAKNVYTGATNPYFVGTGTYAGYKPGQGLTNDNDLIRWMTVPVDMHRSSTYVIFDAILRGDLDYHLWSQEPIQLAVGGQYRELHEITDLSDNIDTTQNPCATVGVTICTSRTSPLLGQRGPNLTGFTRDYDRRSPIISAFAEVKVPITDTFFAQVSSRYEKFYSDVGGKDNEVVVAQGALRWQVTPWFALRATAGQTFSQVAPPAPNDPSFTLVTQLPANQGATVGYTSANWSNTAVKPETGFNYNIGAIFQQGPVTATIDYFDITIDNLARGGSSAAILDAATVPGTTGAGALVNCSSPLLSQTNPLFNGLPFIVAGSGAGGSVNPITGAFTQGACNQGTTTFVDFFQGGDGLVSFFGAQGQQTALVNGGSLETAGIDVSLTWRGSDILGGDLTLSGDFTYYLKYEQSDYAINGITVAEGYDNGIGLLNAGPGHNGQRVAQVRGSVTANYRWGRHNFNWRTSMISSEVNDSASAFISSNTLNANVATTGSYVQVGAACSSQTVIPPVPSAAGSGDFGSRGGVTGTVFTNVGFDACQNVIVGTVQKIPAAFNSDFTYRLLLPKDLNLSLTIQNVFDTDPKFSRDFINYDAYSGSPLGRTFRVGVQKKW